MNLRKDKRGVNQILLVGEIIGALFVSFLLISIGKDWASGEETNKQFLAKDLAFVIDSVYASPFENTKVFYGHNTFGLGSEFKPDSVKVFSLQTGPSFGAVQVVSSVQEFEFSEVEYRPLQSEFGQLINIKPIISQQGPSISVTQEDVENLLAAKIPCDSIETTYIDWREKMLFFFNAPTGIPENIVDSLETDLKLTRSSEEIETTDFIFEIFISELEEEQNEFIIKYLLGPSDSMKKSKKYACILHNRLLDDLGESFTAVKIEALYDMTNTLLTTDKLSIILIAGNKNAVNRPLDSDIGVVIEEALQEFHGEEI